MVSRVTMAISLAAGLTCQMKAVAAGTVNGERSVIHVDPFSPDVRAAYPLVTPTDRDRLLRVKLAEDFDGEIPSDEDQVKIAQDRADELYANRVAKAEKEGKTPPAPPPRLQPMGNPSTDVDAAATKKVEESDILEADQSVARITGLDTRQTTHSTKPPESHAVNGVADGADVTVVSLGTTTTAAAVDEGVDGDAGDAAPASGRGRRRSTAPSE